jgi:hypothetical protein
MSRKEKYLRAFCSIFCTAFVISIGITNARFARASNFCSKVPIYFRRGESMAKQRDKTVTGRVLHDPVKDKLRPMFPLDLSKCRTVDELVRAMGDTAFTGRQIGDAADVFETMARDKECFIVMTLSGALTVGKMGLVFCDLI